MVILNYQKKFHKFIIKSYVVALKQGKVLAFPTDTSYGLAADATNINAIKKLYRIKGRNFNKPVHVVVPSIAYAKKITIWNLAATKLSKNFLPGPLTLILPLKIKDKRLKILSANTGTIGIRMPKNKIALDLAKKLGRPITATSANLAGGADCYSAEEILGQFRKQKIKPDIIINAGQLQRRKPSTMVRVFDDVVKVLRVGPVSEQQIKSLLNTKLY